MAKPEADLKAVEAYLAAVPEPARSTLDETRAMIRKLAPADAVERIGSGMPGFCYKGGLSWCGAAKDHCALCPAPWAIEVFAEELTKYSVCKGTSRFARDKPIPASLMKKI